MTQGSLSIFFHKKHVGTYKNHLSKVLFDFLLNVHDE